MVFRGFRGITPSINSGWFGQIAVICSRRILWESVSYGAVVKKWIRTLHRGHGSSVGQNYMLWKQVPHADASNLQGLQSCLG